MSAGSWKQFSFSMLTAVMAVTLVTGINDAHAGKKPLTCSISPANASVTAGAPITFTSTETGGQGSRSHSWDFSDGPGAPATADTNPVTVSYTSIGTFSVLLDVSFKNGTASCTTNVTVSTGGGNIPPTAADDSYVTTKNVALTVSAPGVLGNDSDADGDILTAVLASDAGFGSLNLNANGSFDYTPDADFVGVDSFSYYADDGAEQSAIAQVTITVNDSQPPSAGELLYRAKCRMCHGEGAAGGFAQREIRTANANRIRGAISRRADMNFLSYLTDTEIGQIADYLDTLPNPPDDIPADGDLAIGEQAFRESCTYCHTFGNGDRVGPDLLGISNTYSDAYLGAWIGYPAEMVAAGAYDPAQLALYPYVMPDLGHSDINTWDITSFLFHQESVGPVIDSDPISLPEGSPEYEATKHLYFNRCAGCHGIYRTGATGPDIGEARAQEIGTDGLGAILRYGTPAGMPNFGQSGLLTEIEISRLAAYLQMPPPAAPPLSMPEIQASWNLVVPVADRPTTPQTTRNWQNYTGVILRDAGQVSIIDGDSHEEVVRVNTGFAVHILRSSANGRYFYSVGRDGLVTMIDLWPETPATVATVKGCHDARSVESSKAPGYEDQVLIEGCYWPPQYVTYNGLTLEPMHRVDVPLVDIEGTSLPENRVASIAASHTKPEWVLALKESGHVGIVDYSLTGHPMTSMLATEKFLHDGGFDKTGKYFMVAANASNKMVVIDIDTPAFVTSFTTGAVPHPGRGANWFDPVYGWVNATPHIGEPKVSVYGADPLNRPDVAWQVVREITLPAAGSLFIKTHPASPWVLVDMALSSDNELQKQVCAIAKATATLDRCFQAADNGKAVHMEFNQPGTEVWVSDWAVDGGVVVLDAVTLAEITRVDGAQTPSGDFITPTGKFNVFNTAHDVY